MNGRTGAAASVTAAPARSGSTGVCEAAAPTTANRCARRAAADRRDGWQSLRTRANGGMRPHSAECKSVRVAKWQIRTRGRWIDVSTLRSPSQLRRYRRFVGPRSLPSFWRRGRARVQRPIGRCSVTYAANASYRHRSRGASTRRFNLPPRRASRRSRGSEEVAGRRRRAGVASRRRACASTRRRSGRRGARTHSDRGARG
jgi:hypothetical protein